MHTAELLRTFALASSFKEGDLLVGGTTDDYVRREARAALAAVTLGELASHRFADDGVSEALERSIDAGAAAEISQTSLGDLRALLLAPGSGAWMDRHGPGLRSETIAGVVKLMTDTELSTVARTIFNPLGETIIGSSGHLGSRIQPNSPGDEEEEILFSVLEGLSYGCGDVVLGINPAADDVETIIRLEELLRSVIESLALPTRYCVLSDIVKQAAARARCRVDVGFQSLAGTSRALAGMVGLDVDGIAELAAGFPGLYFETGQGSEVTNGTAEGMDMTTLEARTYGVARAIRQAVGNPWTIVNDVAGFIGPEVFRNGDQLKRVCLEDEVMAKLHGLTMGLDVCATFHMGIAPAELRHLTAEIAAAAAPAYLMAVAGNADPMLGYLTTSFRDHPRLRRATGRRFATGMEARLRELGAGSTWGDPQVTAALYATYRSARGDDRSRDALVTEAGARVAELRERGFDLGAGVAGAGRPEEDPPETLARLEAIYAQARRALYARVHAAVLRDVSPRHLVARTVASDREDYLAHPATGERIRDEDAARVAALHPDRRPEVQLVISDGLNADALNENLRPLLPALRRELRTRGRHLAPVDVFVENGRVRAGYHVGAVTAADAVVHLIGERPGTGLDTLSAYLTWGRDPGGELRWRPELDHSETTAISGIHRRGKPPEEAATEIAGLIAAMFELRASGVALATRAARRH